MDEKIVVGDVVTLKSGGPSMTVCFQTDEKSECVWFDDNNQLQRAYFVNKTLEK